MARCSLSILQGMTCATTAKSGRVDLHRLMMLERWPPCSTSFICQDSQCSSIAECCQSLKLMMTRESESNHDDAFLLFACVFK